jgi:hypothetical protein
MFLTRAINSLRRRSLARVKLSFIIRRAPIFTLVAPLAPGRCACGSSGRRAGWGRDGLGTGAQGRGSEGAEGVDVAFAP